MLTDPHFVHERAPLLAKVQARWGFMLAGSALCAAITIVLPPYFPLLEPDSPGYLEFDSNRTAFYPWFLRVSLRLGLTLEQITYVQIALFSAALLVLFAALMRARASKWVIAAVAVLFGANSYFSGFHRTIMSESLFFTLTILITAWWIDYLRTGKAKFLALTGLCVGFSIGIRPPGIMLAPMVVISVWLMWHRRNVSVLVLIAAVIGPLVVGPVVERLLYRLEHGGRLESVLSFALMGKAAMLVREQTTFTGPHAQTLNRLGKELYATYVPVHEFLQNLPSTAALPALTGGYEGIAQFQILTQEIAGWSANTGLPGDVLRNELGYQSITDNIPEYLRLSLIHYIGQWSVTSLTFPPTARTVNNYVATFSPPPLEDRLGKIVFLHPPVSWRSIVVYPAFLIAGLVSLVLTFVLIAFLLRPSLGDRGTGQDIMIAAVFAATCHVYTLAISFINVSTPRFLMSVYPQLVMAVLFLILAFGRRAWLPLNDIRNETVGGSA